MVSRERIAEVSGGADATHAEIGDLCYLALVAIDGERDRRLGEKVREWCNGFDPAAGTHAECMSRIAATCPGTSDAYFTLRMLAAALREEDASDR